jgi:DNA-binding response OmpR family regulator
MVMHKILVVDDEVQVGLVLRRILRRAQFEVEVATDAIAALGLVEQFRPDLVISDFRMPHMNGAELVREIGVRWPLIKCMIMSGYVGAVDPICEFVPKPFDTAILLARIRATLVPVAEVAA